MTELWAVIVVQWIVIAALWLRQRVPIEETTSMAKTIRIQQETIDGMARYLSRYAKQNDHTLAGHTRALADQAGAITRMTNMITDGRGR